jgi:NAD(P)-dependent dehydrogenase (short-subunit alcohol dehydrogenase family)
MADRKVALVTGASAGVGRAVARELAEHGFDVGLLARGEAGLRAAAREIEACGVRALVLSADVARYEEVDAAAADLEAQLGPIDVWVNNAMATVFSPAWDCHPDDFRRAVEVTFLGQVWGTMAALERMRPRDRGTIVNVGSALCFVGIPLQSAYCSSKFACRGFFESTRAELLHEGSNVRLHMVHLPAVNTPQFDWCATSLPNHPQPVPPIYQPERAARSIVAASLDERPVRVLGSWNRLLVVLGRAFPNLANRYAALGAWQTQLEAEPISPDRPANLFLPADTEDDWGAHGGFDGRAGGFTDPSFLRSLPSTLGTFVRALTFTAAEKASYVRAFQPHESEERRAGHSV